jgi:hypothetical protein
MRAYKLSEAGSGLRFILPNGTSWAELVLATSASGLFTKILLPAAIMSFQRRPWHWYDHMLMYGGFAFALSLAASLFMWIWALLGKQILFLDGITLVHRREILGLGFSREYDWSAVRNVRVRIQAPAQYIANAPAAAKLVFGFAGAAALAFDYGARTFELGRGLDESSAHELVALINHRFSPPSAPPDNS